MGVTSMISLSALAIGVFASVCPAGASAATKDKNDPSRKICQSIVPSGSRLSTRICKTRAEWDRARDKSQDGVLQHQVRESTGMEPDLLRSPI
jgi:hypothetical protein